MSSTRASCRTAACYSIPFHCCIHITGKILCIPWLDSYWVEILSESSRPSCENVSSFCHLPGGHTMWVAFPWIRPSDTYKNRMKWNACKINRWIYRIEKYISTSQKTVEFKDTTPTFQEHVQHLKQRAYFHTKWTTAIWH